MMGYLKELWKLKQNEGKSASEVQHLQQQELSKLLHYVWNHSAYYRKQFEVAGITQDSLDATPLSAFPAMDKQQLLAHFDELITVHDVTQEDIRRFDAEQEVSRAPFHNKYHVIHSSGSTGKPGYFLYDENAWHKMLVGIIRGALWNMSMFQIIKLLMKGPRIAYIAATDGRYGGAMAVGDGIDGIGGKQIYLDINLPLNQWISKIREFQPNIIIGYPSAIKILAGLVERGEVNGKFLRIISCGEPMDNCLRKYLEQVFGATVVNFYGASESLALGVETNPNDGMILFDDLNIIEMIDGQMYLTCLYNYAQPLIRYRLSDHLHLVPPSGKYPFTKTQGILGRNEDMLWFEDRDGNREFLHPLSIEGFCIEGLVDYQFCQLGMDSFEMRVQVAPSASRETIRQEMLRQMNEILAAKGLSYVTFIVRFVHEILPNPRTGKKQLITESERKKAYAG